MSAFSSTTEIYLSDLPVLSYDGKTETSTDVKHDDKKSKHDLPLTLPSVTKAGWRSNDYFLAFVAGSIFMAEVGMANLFPPLISYQLRRLGYTGVESLTGYFSSMYAAGMCVGAPLVAILGQFVSNKRYLLMGNLVLLACAMVVYLFVQNVPGMYIARCMQGIAAVGIWSFGPGLISDNVSPARGGFFIALSMTGFSIGNVSSQAFGGMLFTRFGWRSICIYGLAFIASSLALCTCLQEKPRAVRELQATDSETLEPSMQSEIEKQVGAGDFVVNHSAWARFRYIFSDMRYVSAYCVQLFNGFYISGLVGTALSLRLADRYHLTAQNTGFTFLAIAGPCLAFIPLAGFCTDRLGARYVLIACLSSFCLWFSLLCIPQLPYPAFLAILVGIGCSASLVNAPVIAYLSSVDHANGNRVGSTVLYGTWNFSYSITAVLFPLMVGPILQKAGVARGWLIVLGILVAVAALALSLVIKYTKVVYFDAQDALSSTTVPEATYEKEKEEV